jgi:hypothetical protein
MASRSERRRQRLAAAGTENRGGTRTGKAGGQYSNRSDLQQAPRAAPGQTYGVATQQKAAQQVNPLPATGGTVAPVSPNPAMDQAAALGARADALPGLMDPTARPNEPVTAGVPFGPGPGPEALGMPTFGPDDQAEAALRAIYRQFPNSDIARVLAHIDARNM